MTKNDKEKLIEAIWYQMPSITLHDKTTDKETIVVEVETLKDFIRNFEVEPTEGSTEDAKKTECTCRPNWEEMYKKTEAEVLDMRNRYDTLRNQLNCAQASLRTFEFIYGRKLNGIC